MGNLENFEIMVLFTGWIASLERVPVRLEALHPLET